MTEGSVKEFETKISLGLISWLISGSTTTLLRKYYFYEGIIIVKVTE